MSLKLVPSLGEDEMKPDVLIAEPEPFTYEQHGDLQAQPFENVLESRLNVSSVKHDKAPSTREIRIFDLARLLMNHHLEQFDVDETQVYI